jgi:hypothetical protein
MKGSLKEWADVYGIDINIIILMIVAGTLSTAAIISVIIFLLVKWIS